MIIIKTRGGTKQIGESSPKEKMYFTAFINQWEQAIPSRWSPSVDIFELVDEYVVRMEIAGMEEEDFTITLDKNMLTIRGTRHDTQPKLAFHQMEIHYGEFHTEIAFSALINFEEVNAVYKNGFLQIQMPKAKPNQISIQKS
jgi:HSP20 family protein